MPSRVCDTRSSRRVEFLEPLPVVSETTGRIGADDRLQCDHARIDGKTWVQQKGVKEIWIWGYHGGVVGLWESNMAGPFGDISNCNRDPKDLPVLDRTYTVYHYNYQRDTGEAVEDHMHQFEALFNEIDGRDRTPAKEWPKLLFWGKFVGSDRSHKMVPVTTPDGRKVYRCGWTHYPPNASRITTGPTSGSSRPTSRTGGPTASARRSRSTATAGSGNSLKWFVYWMQNIPGADNGLSYQGRPLTNWWRFVGDWDQARKNKVTLTKMAKQKNETR